jgi:hypothetical protein
MSEAHVALHVESLDGHPEAPDAGLAFVLVHELEVKLISGTCDHTHGDELRLTPEGSVGGIDWSHGIAKGARGRGDTHEYPDMIVRCEIRLYGRLPHQPVVLRKHRHVPIASESVLSGIGGHNGSGDDG